MNAELIWNMENIVDDVLFKHSNTFKNNDNIIKIQDTQFTLFSVVKIINSLKYLKSRKSYFNIHLIINSKSIVDEATILVFETLIYEIVKELKIVFIRFNNIDIKHSSFHFLRYSLFFYHISGERIKSLIHTERKIDSSYLEKFEHPNIATTIQSFRGAINSNDKKSLDSLHTDLFLALKHFKYTDNYSINKEIISNVYEAVVELIDNAIEHSSSDCIFSLKCGNLVDNDQKSFHLISFCVVDFSEKLIGSNICEIIKHDNHKINSNNEIVFEAYENHKKMFNENYDFNSFGLVSAFQQKVSSREEKGNAAISGSGLSRCLSILQIYGEMHRCYLISGKDYLRFLDNFINYNSEGNIGFNENNVYLNQIPNSEVLMRNKIFMPGTLYCLDFLVKEE